MGKERAAVLGVGQTKYDTTYPGSMAGMLREAATNALEMSGKGWDDIDAVIMGKAPDFFEGVMMPEVYLAEAISPGFRKPVAIKILNQQRRGKHIPCSTWMHRFMVRQIPC